MKNTLLILSFLLFFASGVLAQTTQTSNCPTLEVTGGGVVEPNEPLTFTANVGDYDLSKLTFNWTVSSGEIIEGQGTPTIKVSRKNNNENITAVVEVNEPSRGCVLTDFETGAVCGCRVPRLFDEYGPLPNGHVKAQTQNLYFELNIDPGSQGYIINYGTSREITRREKQIRNTIVFLNLDASRFTLVRGGANPRGKGIWTRVWIVPAGAENPTTDL